MVVHSDKMVMKKSASWPLDLADELRGNPRAMGESIENISDFFGFLNQWPLQDPKLEVPTIYKAYFSGLCKGISPQNMAKHMVLTYLHFRILKFLLT